jgi:hypothetical protein
MNDRINHGIGRSCQLPRSWLRTVHLEDIRGDIHCRVVVNAVELEKRVTDCNLKTRDEFRRCFLAPAIEKNPASQRGNMVRIPDEFAMGRGQGIYRRKFAIISPAPQQSVSVAFSASVLICRAARFSLSGSENAGGRLLLRGQHEASCAEYGDGRQDSFQIHLLTSQTGRLYSSPKSPSPHGRSRSPHQLHV